MLRCSLVLMLAWILSASFPSIPAYAQEWAVKQLENSPRHGEWVVVEYGGRKVDAFVVYPEVQEKRWRSS